MALETIIRPSAILSAAGLWHRYDRSWNGPSGSRGTAQLAGSIAVIYESPVRNQITIYKVMITDAGSREGLTVDSLCDEALAHAGLTLASCPRITMTGPPLTDPFQLPLRPTIRARTARR